MYTQKHKQQQQQQYQQQQQQVHQQHQQKQHRQRRRRQQQRQVKLQSFVNLFMVLNCPVAIALMLVVANPPGEWLYLKDCDEKCPGRDDARCQ